MPVTTKRLFGCLVAYSLWCLGAAHIWAQVLSYSTLAGNAGYGSTDGPTNKARFNFPQGVAADALGNVYVADTQNSTIRTIGSNGMVATLAGLAGRIGSSNGFGSAARFANPQGIAVGLTNLYVADTANSTIREITPAGLVGTIAGSPGMKGSSNGVNSGALFNFPAGIAVDASGVLYVADTLNSTIRMLRFNGTNWVVTTIAGLAGVNTNLNGTNTDARFFQPMGLAVDANQNLYVADTGNNAIRKITPTGTNWVTTTLATLSLPTGVTVGTNGNIYVADAGDDTIRELMPSGTNWLVSILAGSSGVAGSTDGSVTATFNYPSGISADSSGRLFVADSLNNTIRQINTGGVVSTLAGLAGGPGSADGLRSQASFDGPLGVAVDAARNLYVADSQNNTIRQISAAGVVTTLAGAATNLPGSDDGAGTNASFNDPVSLVVDSSTNIYVADEINNEIRKVALSSNNWVVTTIAGSSGAFFAGLVTNIVGNFTNVSATGFLHSSLFTNFSGLVTNITANTTNVIVVITNIPVITNVFGGSSNVISLMTNVFTLPLVQPRLDGVGTNALFFHPSAIALDRSGDLYVADGGTNGVRFITSGNAVTTLVGSAGAYKVGTNSLFFRSSGVAVDGAGNIYVSDAANTVIREISAGGMVTTIAGLPGFFGTADGTNSQARFVSPTGIAVDAQTNLFVMDSLSHTIREITPAGTNWVVRTVGGMANLAGSADGTGTNALFNEPGGVAVDAAGNLYIADTGNNTVRLGQAAAAINIVLQITPSKNQATLSWPASVLDFALETSTNLSGPLVWTQLTNLPPNSGGQFVITNITLAPAAFFRLHED